MGYEPRCDCKHCFYEREWRLHVWGCDRPWDLAYRSLSYDPALRAVQEAVTEMIHKKDLT